MARRIGFGMQDRNPARQRILRELAETVNDRAGVTVTVDTPVTADQEFAVRHSLGQKAREVSIVSQDKAGAIYRSQPNRWTKDCVLLKYSGAGGRIVLKIA